MGVTLMEIELEAPIDPTPGVHHRPCLGSCVPLLHSTWVSDHSAQAGHSEHQTLRQAGG